MRKFNRHVYDRTDGAYGRLNGGVSFQIEIHDNGYPVEFQFAVTVVNSSEGDRFSRKEANELLSERFDRGQTFHGTYHHSLTAVQNCALTMADYYLNNRRNGTLEDKDAKFIKRALNDLSELIGINCQYDDFLNGAIHADFDEDFMEKLCHRVFNKKEKL